jgi:hypothetical protein
VSPRTHNNTHRNHWTPTPVPLAVTFYHSILVSRGALVSSNGAGTHADPACSIRWCTWQRPGYRRGICATTGGVPERVRVRHGLTCGGRVCRCHKSLVSATRQSNHGLLRKRNPLDSLTTRCHESLRNPCPYDDGGRQKSGCNVGAGNPPSGFDHVSQPSLLAFHGILAFVLVALPRDCARRSDAFANYTSQHSGVKRPARLVNVTSGSTKGYGSAHVLHLTRSSVVSIAVSRISVACRQESYDSCASRVGASQHRALHIPHIRGVEVYQNMLAADPLID